VTLRVLHVITTLDRAGAELLLANTVSAFDPDRVRGDVVCLAARGEVADRIEAAGWQVHSLGMRSGRIRPADLARLRAIVQDLAPDVVHTWMYHADLLGGLVSRLLARTPVIWSLHQSALPRGEIRTATRLIARFNAALSWWVPARIVATSVAARRFHARLGYRRSRMEFIPTAFPVPVPDSSAGERLRRELGIPSDAPIVGRVGRFHPQKDYPTLMVAAEAFLAQRPDAHLVLVGRDVDDENPDLRVPTDPDIGRRIHLLGERDDAARLTAGFDVAVSSSAFGESTPLVIGEAMAARVPVITTDVGDCAHLVGDTGMVVSARDPEQLSTSILELLQAGPEERATRGRAARRRIEDVFSLDAMVEHYTELYRDVAGHAGRVV
jgi:glycosyltransferase involved in cell wall biosynthesis